MTAIEWTHRPGTKGETWNPVVGCSIVSPGCTNCYAMKMAGRILNMNAGRALDRASALEAQFIDYGTPEQLARHGVALASGTSHYDGTVRWAKEKPVWTGKVAPAPDHILTKPLRWKSPRTIFVNSMGDLFHESVPDAWIDRVFAVMGECPRHTFIVLTKRSKRMRNYMKSLYLLKWPPPNVWLGVSAEDQTRADERIPYLMETPAAVRFVSAEPLLGPVDFTSGWRQWLSPFETDNNGPILPGLDWVIAGGESGPGARPMHPDWARSIRDQCSAAGVPFFFKQWGAWGLLADGDGDPDQRLAHRRDWMLVYPNGKTDIPDHRWPSKADGECAMVPVGKSRAGRRLDGVEHSAWPGPTSAQREAA